MGIPTAAGCCVRLPHTVVVPRKPQKGLRRDSRPHSHRRIQTIYLAPSRHQYSWHAYCADLSLAGCGSNSLRP